VVLISALTYSLILFGLATLRREYLALALPMAAFLFAGLLYNPTKMKLDVQRSMNSRRVQIGMPISVTLTVTNQGAPIELVWLVDTLPANVTKLEGPNRLLTPLGSGESASITYQIDAPRGAYHFPDVDVTISDLLGIIHRQKNYETEDNFAVMPSVRDLPRIPIHPRQTRAQPGVIPARVGGPGISFFGVREYQPGDPLRWVNWRASARHDQSLFTNEFEQERAANVSIVLDARQQSNLIIGKDSLFEYAVLAAASLAQVFLNDGNRVGLVHYGGYISWTFPGYGKVQRERILRALAHARVGESMVEHLEYMPTRFFAPGSQIVLISPLLKGDVDSIVRMRALGFAVLLISPDPISFELQAMQTIPAVKTAARIARMERKVLLGKLQHAGIRTMNWDVSIPFEQAIFTLTRGIGRFVRRGS
jgi:uncharacterized protein (DUF58 family)